MPAYSFPDNLVSIKPAAAQRTPYADGLLATKAVHDDHLGNIVLMIIVIPSGFTSRVFRFPTRLPCWTPALAFPFPDFTPPAGGVSPTLAFASLAGVSLDFKFTAWSPPDLAASAV